MIQPNTIQLKYKFYKTRQMLSITYDQVGETKTECKSTTHRFLVDVQIHNIYLNLIQSSFVQFLWQKIQTLIITKYNH